MATGGSAFGADGNNLVLDEIVVLGQVRLHGACPNRMDPPAFHYDFAEVEYVQILKGPYDLANPGSLGGLVEATSKKPIKGLNADLSVTGGSYDSVNTSLDLQVRKDLAAGRGIQTPGILGPGHPPDERPVSGEFT